MIDTLDANTRHALEELLAVAQRDTGQSRRCANFLLAWWNAAENGGFDLSELWGLDRELASACAVVFAWVAQHGVYPDTLGYGPQFEALAKAWLNDREPNESADPLVPLGLATAIRAQASKLLRAISSAENLPDMLLAATRAEGFVLGLETVRALTPADVEGLYLVFDRASQVRQAELA